MTRRAPDARRPGRLPGVAGVGAAGGVRPFAETTMLRLANYDGEAPANPCPFCGVGEATRLCDYVIANEWRGRELFRGTRIRTLDGAEFTCDRPMCEGCATEGVRLHWHAHDDDVRPSGGFIVREFCPDCARLVRRHRPPPVLSAAEADALRGRMWRAAGPVPAAAE